MSVKRTQTIFLGSANRTGGTSLDCQFQFDSDLIKATRDETIQLTLKDYCQRNSYYDVVTGVNDTFVVEPAAPIFGPQIKQGINDTFKIKIGTISPQTYTSHSPMAELHFEQSWWH